MSRTFRQTFRWTELSEKLSVIFSCYWPEKEREKEEREKEKEKRKKRGKRGKTLFEYDNDTMRMFTNEFVKCLPSSVRDNGYLDALHAMEYKQEPK